MVVDTESRLIIRAIVADVRRSHLAHVYVGEQDLLVDATHVAQLGLRSGQTLTEAEIEQLVEFAQVTGARECALSLLAHRTYTEKELSDRLQRREFSHKATAQALAWLRELGLVDDAAYAKRWVEHRRHTKGLGPVRLRHELRERGVAPDLIDDALATLTDEDHETTALEVASARLARMGQTPPRKARRQLYEFLLRRGFSSGTAARVLGRLFDEFPA